MSAAGDERRYSRDGAWVWDGGDWVRVAPRHRPAAHPLAGIDRRGRIALGVVAALMAAAIAAGFAVAVMDSATVASPQAADAAPPALRAATAADLRQAVAAQERIRTDSGRYADTTAALVDAGLQTTLGVTVRVLRADTTAYCMSATSGGITLYASQATPAPAPAPCR